MPYVSDSSSTMAMVSFARNFMRSYLQPVADLVHGQQPVFPADLFA